MPVASSSSSPFRFLPTIRFNRTTNIEPLPTPLLPPTPMPVADIRTAYQNRYPNAAPPKPQGDPNQSHHTVTAIPLLVRDDYVYVAVIPTRFGRPQNGGLEPPAGITISVIPRNRIQRLNDTQLETAIRNMKPINISIASVAPPIREENRPKTPDRKDSGRKSWRGKK